jgi:nitroimidazol reductase NimA-like FMN-containing flavoprotein (pyridoxamine 5'-phosphate oxidase superfamily)
LRRHDKEITDQKLLESILQMAPVCRIGMASGNIPYVVPMNFAYRDGCVYVHSAPSGRKIDMIEGNNLVCLQADIMADVVKAPAACHWGTRYYSVIAFGRASIIADNAQKETALNLLMEKYSGKTGWEYEKAMLENMVVIQITLESMTGKRSGYGPGEVPE